MSERRWWQLSKPRRRQLWAASGYMPNAAQWPIHLDPSRTRLVAGGERGGKSRLAAEEMLVWIYVCPDAEAIWWIVGPDYEQTHQEFQYLLTSLQVLNKVASVSMPQVGSWELHLKDGGLIKTKTSSDVLTIASVAPHGVLMTEAAQQSRAAFDKCRARVAEHRGPLLPSGTFHTSRNWFAVAWREWKVANPFDARAFSLPTWSNLSVFPGGRQDQEILDLERDFAPRKFQEMFGAVPCLPETAVFGEFDPDTHVSARAKYIAGVPVQLWIDPGWQHPYAVLAVHILGEQALHFDEVYLQHKSTEKVIEECKSRAWWKDVRRGVMDIAGRQHHGGESEIEKWWRITGLSIASSTVAIDIGIGRHRDFLVVNPLDASEHPGEARLLHSSVCVNTIREYGEYQYREIVEGRDATEKPIDTNNDAMKALAYGLVYRFGVADRRIPQRLPDVRVSIHR